jgi:small subunit ribosomal protein S16
MVRIRLRRVGLKKQPSYRIVVADQHSARNGGYIENIGFHNPRTIPSTDDVDEARALYWLSVGAQPSEAIVALFKRTGTLARFERLRKGESIEALAQEAAAAKAAAAPVSPKTRHAAPAGGQGQQAAEGEAQA